MHFVNNHREGCHSNNIKDGKFMSPHRMLGERLANYPWACWNSNCRAAPCEGSAIAVSCAHRDEPQSQALQHQARHEDAQMYGPRAHAVLRPSLPADVGAVLFAPFLSMMARIPTHEQKALNSEVQNKAHHKAQSLPTVNLSHIGSHSIEWPLDLWRTFSSSSLASLSQFWSTRLLSILPMKWKG